MELLIIKKPSLKKYHHTLFICTCEILTNFMYDNGIIKIFSWNCFLGTQLTSLSHPEMWPDNHDPLSLAKLEERRVRQLIQSGPMRIFVFCICIWDCRIFVILTALFVGLPYSAVHIENWKKATWRERDEWSRCWERIYNGCHLGLFFSK